MTVQPKDADSLGFGRPSRGEWVVHDPEGILSDDDRREIIEQAWKDHPNGILGADDEVSGTEPWPLDSSDTENVVSWWIEWLDDNDE